MSWLAWLVVSLLALSAFLLHRAALYYLHRLALRRLQRRTHRWLRSSVASSVHDALLTLLPASLLASAYTAEAQLCAAQSLRIEWPLASCLRAITIHLQQPLLDITLQPADDAAADERKAADKQTETTATATSQPRPVVISSSQAVLLRWFRVTIIATDIRCHISAPDVAVDIQLAVARADVRWSKRGDGGAECQLRLDDCAARLRYPTVAKQQVAFPSTLLHNKLLTASFVLPFHRTASSLLPRRSSRILSPFHTSSLPPSAAASSPARSSRTYYSYTPALHALQVELGWDGLKGDVRLDQVCCFIACLHLAVDALRGRTGTRRRSQLAVPQEPQSSAASSSLPPTRPSPPLPPRIVLKATSKVSRTTLWPAVTTPLPAASQQPLTVLFVFVCVAVLPIVQCVLPASSGARINSSATADWPHLLLTRPAHSHLSPLYISPRWRDYHSTLAVASAYYTACPRAAYHLSLPLYRSRATRSTAVSAANAAVAIDSCFLADSCTAVRRTLVHSADAVLAASTVIVVH